jgi:23S rRNA (cytosine1962-C5)-methyltransferase
MTDLTLFEESVAKALARREAMIERLAGDRTDCYRLFHGTQEGAPGITIDRYGDLVLMQSFHHQVPDGAAAIAARLIDSVLPGLDLIYNDRSSPGSRVRNRLEAAQQAEAERERIVSEHGIRFHIKARHRGQDPWLFLDLRPTRRAIMREASGKSLLNLFAYTCGTGVAAAVAGASRVVNVDFARSSLAVGTVNAELNAISDRMTQLVSDVFPAIRQIAGIRQPPVTRGRRLPAFPRVERQLFDLVFLDPPPRATSPFGTVDVVRDYPSLLKPALGAVADGGALYCTNNAARVDDRDWHSVLRQCGEKHGRPIRTLDVVRPGEDFPSSDDRPPLKVVRLGL